MKKLNQEIRRSLIATVRSWSLLLDIIALITGYLIRAGITYIISYKILSLLGIPTVSHKLGYVSWLCLHLLYRMRRDA